MATNIIPLRTKQRTTKKPGSDFNRNRNPHQSKLESVIRQAHRETDEAGSTQDLSRFPLLRTLAWLAKTAKPRARSIEYHGVRFRLSHGLWKTDVICLRTGRRLVGTVTL